MAARGHDTTHHQRGEGDPGAAPELHRVAIAR